MAEKMNSLWPTGEEEDYVGKQALARHTGSLMFKRAAVRKRAVGGSRPKIQVCGAKLKSVGKVEKLSQNQAPRVSKPGTIDENGLPGFWLPWQEGRGREVDKTSSLTLGRLPDLRVRKMRKCRCAAELQRNS